MKAPFGIGLALRAHAEAAEDAVFEAHGTASTESEVGAAACAELNRPASLDLIACHLEHWRGG